ncbi:hypothetical protein N656DRAFT_837446 [Canariomyces notabilis]|uniref:Uncharacterized protein n=1 Tax=Canariomyces notabilis TaxID=2074819 RepID=A0AAN6TCQ0_9PEZI|nr:hypothetical protein N656DRAFT_837446 [Canariomyces arenarius]
MDPRLLVCCSYQEDSKTRRDSGHRCWASETLEIGIAALCSFVTWEYTIQNEGSREYNDRLPGQHIVEKHADGSIFRPSPSLLLFSCLVFGCCVSSFTHRRQTEDQYQAVVYVVLLAGAAVAGYAVGADVHLILLGYLPWATCAAMALSISGHGLYRWLQRDSRPAQGDEEKVPLMG